MNKLNTLFYYLKKFINNEKLIHTDINKNNFFHNHINYYKITHNYIENENIYKNNIKIKSDLEKFLLFIH